MNTSKRRLSPSLIISVLALFVALGGTSYAAVKINGKDIKNNTVAGKALKKNTVTGKQVKESSLGKVPSAKVADSATSATTAATATNATTAANAGNADTVGGKTAAEISAPAAYAKINFTPGGATSEPDFAKGITDANLSVDSSFVCVNGLDFDPKNASATVFRVGGGTTVAITQVDLANQSFCPGAEQAAIQLVNADGNPITTGHFYLTLFR